MRIVGKILNRIKSFFKDNEFYCWHFVRKKEYNSLIEKLQSNYINKTINNISFTSKNVICVFDGRIRQGGLADRLRGIVSTYLICKENKLNFKILFEHPFNLSDYLIPNKVDWFIERQEVNFNLQYSEILFLNTQTGSKYEAKKQKKWLERKIRKSSYNEIHVITNALFSYEHNYSELFKELFKPSARLEKSIVRFKNILGNNYISVSCRFLDLLSDFNETSSTVEKLSDKEKHELIQLNINQLYKLHEKEPNRTILVNSDSVSFLEIVKELSFTYVIEGNITHIDNSSISSYETYEKTFIDFYMIANASEIYLFKTSLMHNSGYPYAASFIYNRPFHLIEF